MATNFFRLIREGDDGKIAEYIGNLGELAAIETALNSDPTLVSLVGGYVS